MIIIIIIILKIIKQIKCSSADASLFSDTKVINFHNQQSRGTMKISMHSVNYQYKVPMCTYVL